MSVFKVWKQDILHRRGLQAPDGRSLYLYRITDEEFYELENLLNSNLKRYQKVIDLGTVSSHIVAFPAVFVLYAAEWWRRRYDGSGWSWDPILHDLSADPGGWSTEQRSHCVKNGLREWALKLRETGGFRYLGAIALQGGLPMRLLAEAQGQLGRILSQVLRQAQSGSVGLKDIVSWMESMQSYLPKTYRQSEIYTLLAEVVWTVLRLKEEAKLLESTEAVAQLDRTVPDWRERFPMPVTDAHAQGLLEQLIRDVTTARTVSRALPLPVERWLEQTGNGIWSLSSSIELPDKLTAAELNRLFSHEGPMPRTLELSLDLGGERRSVNLRRLLGHDDYRVDRLPWRQEGEQAADQHVLRLLAPSGQSWTAQPSKGEALDPDLPWVFGLQRERSRLLRQGSGAVVAVEALMAIQKGWSVNPERDSLAEFQGRMEGPVRHQIQSIRFAWRCANCGASGSSHSWQESQHCAHCGEVIQTQHIRQFLAPAGFAVDFYSNPHNDVSTQSFVPVEPPWVDAEGDWFPLPNPALGRFRATERGHVFHQSNGIHGLGYAICLACGRTEPMIQKLDGTPEMPKAFDKPHSRLRGSRKNDSDSICPGSQESWKIKRDIALGHETYTDVLEIQIKTLAGAWLDDRTAALTLAVALRDALAELLGVQATELGCDIKPSRSESDGQCQSILIYDRFAAGYASDAGRFLGQLFEKAFRRLQCRADCDSVCPQCILDFDQRFAVENLDRHVALRIVTKEWLHALRLPEELAFFGPQSRLEYSQLREAVWRELKGGVSRVRLFADGKSTDWDVGPSPLRQLAYRLAGSGQQQSIEILLPQAQVEQAREEDRHLLGSLADHPGIEIIGLADMARAGSSRVLVEVIRSDMAIRWAMADNTASILNIEWGTHKAPLIVGYNLPVLSLKGRFYKASDLRPPVTDEGDREIVVHRELDGSLQGFGQRFWTLVAEQHPATAKLLKDEQVDVKAIQYWDRYLFTPLAVALLVELIDGLRKVITPYRWDDPTLVVVTTDARSERAERLSDRVWSDWPDMKVRNQALVEAFEYVGIDIDLQIVDKTKAAHGRRLVIEFSSGFALTLRLDQGVSYWRAPAFAPEQRRMSWFDFRTDKPAQQGQKLAELALPVEGALHPTELFVKVR